MGRIATAKGAIGVEELGRIEVAEDEVAPIPIVFLHGVGSDKSVWRPQLDHFSRSRHAIAFDYPGYGTSDPADSEADHDDFAAAILAAMDALEIEPAPTSAACRWAGSSPSRCTMPRPIAAPR